MHNNTVAHETSLNTAQFSEELLGPWYNYEASEITLATQEFDHWLSKLEETWNQPIA
jgi:hypothetical protein